MSNSEYHPDQEQRQYVLKRFDLVLVSLDRLAYEVEEQRKTIDYIMDKLIQLEGSKESQGEG